LLVSYTPKGASSLNLTFGTLDAPLGFERDDEVLTFTPSTSFNFELAGPSKLTGLFGTYETASTRPRSSPCSAVNTRTESPTHQH
jgi:hypothetical protein